jgi:lipopolysaccharide/colanic/teichoic acid biosynthesis glycosyltransferase
VNGFYGRFGKRLFDVVGAIIGLVLTLPIQIVVAGLVRHQMGSPIFFRQQRPGQGGRPFTLVKFRTMSNTPDTRVSPLFDERRLTPLGRKLRSTSIDELPEFWNVLRGDMSLVGPRPLLTEYLDLYSFDQSRRHLVRPGITGFAQVSGRNSISWSEKFNLDVWYVDNLSFVLDLRILWRTIFAVVSRTGVSAQGGATVDPFQGND